MADFASTLLSPLLAQSATAIGISSGTHSASWALVLFCVILGLIVALNPPRRTSEIKKPAE
jgi:hypothetical protein